MHKIESWFEKGLWYSRLIVLLAVIGSVVTAVAVLVVATLDVVYLLTHLGGYLQPDMNGDPRAALRAEMIAHVVHIVDGYLLGGIMLIFGMGLYELFVNRIDPAEGSEFGSRALLIRSVDDLKDRLAKVVVLILVVTFLQHAIKLKYPAAGDLLYLAAGIVLIGAALFLTARKV